MDKLLNYLIIKIKKNDYKLDVSLNIISLLSIAWDRGLLLLRGFFMRIGLKEAGSILFIGKGVTLKHKSFITLKSGVTLDDHVVLEGLSREGLILEENVKIGSFTKIACTGTLKKLGKGIKIGANSGVGDYSFFGAAGGIEIGENVIMGQNVRFHSENHNFDRLDIPIKEQGVTNIGIRIGDDCWIGAGAVFLDGVNVGEGCVIGANTLVNKDIPPYSVAVGSPVKIVKSRLAVGSKI
ncbi:acyltransferase [Paenibacillus sp. WC2504]|uniref:acyltransferase n=1 Tax=Paenibacillus sp. WC2504 TaxID=3461403 RepID=UPI0040453742